ncbi:MAG: PPC domain-containing DNA-binding protein [Candidatus Bilamarchaeum sp.]
MDFQKIKMGYLIRLDEDEEVLSSIKDFCTQKKIYSASISGLGAAKSAEIAHYDTKEKKYYTKKLEGMLEVVFLVGNISKLKNAPMAHIHIALGLPDFSTVSGHVMKIIVNPTCEINLLVNTGKVERKFDEKSGLNLQCFVK